ncbi:hypothetical protein ACFY2Q_27020 [Micromonospora sp. NPDC000316]|uniref:hypothetical protein n=1 Tax=Micromonospora sp. NPDC000316 TaxID=3364216 RepID=UPI0036ACBDF9
MTRIRAVVTAVLVGLVLALLSTGPAAAHGGKLKLEVAGDGAEGVTIQATYGDGHRLDKPVRLVLTGTGPDGQKLGPLQLEPAPEGQGFYSSGPVLSPGRWRVTVTAPAPNPGKAAAEIQATVAQTAPAPAPVAMTAAADTPRGRGVGGGWWPIAAAGLVLTAAAMGVAMLFGRRRAS